MFDQNIEKKITMMKNLIVLHLCLEFAQPMLRHSQPNSGVFRMCWTYVSTFSAHVTTLSIKIGYISTLSTEIGHVLCLT